MPDFNRLSITRLTIIIVVSSGLLACSNDSISSDTPPLESLLQLDTLKQKASYSYGVDIASRLTQQGIELDAKALNQGITDAFNNAELVLSEEERLQAKTDFQTVLRDAVIKKQADIAEKNLADGKAFLEANEKKDGVITIESGLQYKIITKGDGKQPKASDTVTTHYTGTLIDGREFDSSIKRGTPASFPVKGVIKGWTEALQLMHVGDKWQLFIPSELAYGATARSELIEANSTLIFELELLGIKE
jgi:FKBP-type peptidyl-prolyl cis-trans isomerase FklB